MKRWIITHWKALQRFPSEEGLGYRERLAFEAGVWDGERRDEEETPCPYGCIPAM